MKFEIRVVSAEQTHYLRQKILRPNQPIEEMIYPNDSNPSSLHLAAFENQNLIGIISLYPESQEGEVQNQVWRLRGMAVEEHLRGQGVGQALVRDAMVEVASRGGETIWCNARTQAMGFYKHLGFEIQGDEFHIPGIGPHYIAQLSL